MVRLDLAAAGDAGGRQTGVTKPWSATKSAAPTRVRGEGGSTAEDASGPQPPSHGETTLLLRNTPLTAENPNPTSGAVCLFPRANSRRQGNEHLGLTAAGASGPRPPHSHGETAQQRNKPLPAETQRYVRAVCPFLRANRRRLGDEHTCLAIVLSPRNSPLCFLARKA